MGKRLRGLAPIFTKSDTTTQRARKLTRLGILLLLVIAVGACAVTQINTPLSQLLNTVEVARLFPKSTATPPDTTTPSPAELPLSLPESVPTASLTKKATAVPSMENSPTPQITPSPTLQESSDLLYLSKNKLMRWDHVTRYSSLLMENVVRVHQPGVNPFSPV